MACSPTTCLTPPPGAVVPTRQVPCDDVVHEAFDPQPGHDPDIALHGLFHHREVPTAVADDQVPPMVSRLEHTPPNPVRPRYMSRRPRSARLPANEVWMLEGRFEEAERLEKTAAGVHDRSGRVRDPRAGGVSVASRGAVDDGGRRRHMDPHGGGAVVAAGASNRSQTRPHVEFRRLRALHLRQDAPEGPVRLPLEGPYRDP